MDLTCMVSQDPDMRNQLGCHTTWRLESPCDKNATFPYYLLSSSLIIGLSFSAGHARPSLQLSVAMWPSSVPGYIQECKELAPREGLDLHFFFLPAGKNANTRRNLHNHLEPQEQEREVKTAGTTGWLPAVILFTYCDFEFSGTDDQAIKDIHLRKKWKRVRKIENKQTKTIQHQEGYCWPLTFKWFLQTGTRSNPSCCTLLGLQPRQEKLITVERKKLMLACRPHHVAQWVIFFPGSTFCYLVVHH